MDYRRQREQLRQMLPQLIDTTCTRSKGGMYICPICGSGTGTHKTGALSVYYHNGAPRWKCHSCGAGGDTFDFVGEVYRISEYMDRVRKAEDILLGGDRVQMDAVIKPMAVEKEYKSQMGFIKYCKEHYDGSYLRSRGISDETASRFWIGTKKDFWYWDDYDEAVDTAEPEEMPDGVLRVKRFMDAVIIPTSEYSYVARCTDGRGTRKVTKRGPAMPFGLKHISKYPEIAVVEGEIDALSLWEIGQPAVGLGSTGNASKLIDFFREHRNVRPHVIIIPDRDEAGEECAQKLAASFRVLGVDYSIGTCLLDAFGDDSIKDINDALVADRDMLQGLLYTGS